MILVLPFDPAGDLRDMDSWKQGSAQPQATPAEASDGRPAWSMGRLVELVDAAIDSAGAQLARSGGLWDDSPSPFDERDWPSRRQQGRVLTSRELLEEQDLDSGRSMK
jgi:hypothetical protein